MSSLYGVEQGLPSAEDLGKIKLIREACRKEIACLKDPDEDIIGDLRVVRFLHSRKGNVETATEWFRNFLVWRVTEQPPGGTPEDWRREVAGRSVDNFRQWYLRRSNPHDPMNPCAGENEDGMLLTWLAMGFLDPKSWTESHHPQYSEDDDFKLAIQYLEWTYWELERRSREQGKLSYVVKMIDMKGSGEDGRQSFLWWDRKYSDFILKRITPLAQHHYCDHDSMFVVVNAPRLFSVMWNAVKYVLTERQRSKFKILSSSSEPSNQKVLMQVWPKEHLPLEYGGSLVSIERVYPPAGKADKERFHAERHLIDIEYPEQKAAEQVAEGCLDTSSPAPCGAPNATLQPSEASPMAAGASGRDSDAVPKDTEFVAVAEEVLTCESNAGIQPAAASWFSCC